MKKLYLASVISSVLLISACSGGGGGAGEAKTSDGEVINLTLSEKGFIEAKTRDGYLRGYNDDNSFYGMWLNDQKTLSEVRYQGTQTETSRIPRGSATYVGSNVYKDALSGEIIRAGTSTLNVDFDNKTVSGELSRPGVARDITLHEGRLDGAKFSGNASVLLNSNGKYEGALFGKNAEEAAGIVTFSNDAGLNTSFGGRR